MGAAAASAAASGVNWTDMGEAASSSLGALIGGNISGEGSSSAIGTESNVNVQVGAQDQKSVTKNQGEQQQQTSVNRLGEDDLSKLTSMVLNGGIAGNANTFSEQAANRLSAGAADAASNQVLRQGFAPVAQAGSNVGGFNSTVQANMANQQDVLAREAHAGQTLDMQKLFAQLRKVDEEQMGGSLSSLLGSVAGTVTDQNTLDTSQSGTESELETSSINTQQNTSAGFKQQTSVENQSGALDWLFGNQDTYASVDSPVNAILAQLVNYTAGAGTVKGAEDHLGLSDQQIALLNQSNSDINPNVALADQGEQQQSVADAEAELADLLKALKDAQEAAKPKPSTSNSSSTPTKTSEEKEQESWDANTLVAPSYRRD